MLRTGWKRLLLCGLASGWGAAVVAQDRLPSGVAGAAPSAVPATGPFSAAAFDEDLPGTLRGDEPPLVVFDPRLPPDVWYAQADYLCWWIKKAAGPAVFATVGDENDPVPGALDQPGTTPILAGGAKFGALSGGRLTFGAWDSPEQVVGWEFSGFLLENKPNRVDLAALGQGRDVYIPYNDFFFGESAGTIDPGDRAFLTQYSHFGGLQGVLQIGARRTETWDTSWFGGVRYQRLVESLALDVHSVTDTLDETVSDRFQTRSQFFGGYFGGKFEKRLDVFFVRGRGGVGLGYNQDRLSIGGSYVEAISGTSLPGGVYAQPSNSGVQNRHAFATTTDFTLGLGANLTRNLRFTTNYDFSYWSRVVRPGEQLDRNVNSFSFIAGPQIPPQKFETTSFYAQGVSFSLEYHY